MGGGGLGEIIADVHFQWRTVGGFIMDCCLSKNQKSYFEKRFFYR